MKYLIFLHKLDDDIDKQNYIMIIIIILEFIKINNFW